MLSRSRFVLSLVVALSLSTLALADSAPVSIAFLHSSTGVSAASHINSSSDHVNQNATWSSHADVSPSGNGGSLQLHGTISRKNGNWGAWHVGAPGTSKPQPLSTPEPGSLMLLSTGLMGIAGVLRRKLRRV
jgi:PEP-CTERM motif